MIGKMYRFKMTGSGKFPVWILSKYGSAPETKGDLSVMFEETTKPRTLMLMSKLKPDERAVRDFGWDIHIVHDPRYSKDDYNLYHTWPC